MIWLNWNDYSITLITTLQLIHSFKENHAHIVWLKSESARHSSKNWKLNYNIFHELETISISLGWDLRLRKNLHARCIIAFTIFRTIWPNFLGHYTLCYCKPVLEASKSIRSRGKPLMMRTRNQFTELHSHNKRNKLIWWVQFWLLSDKQKRLI